MEELRYPGMGANIESSPYKHYEENQRTGSPAADPYKNMNTANVFGLRATSLGPIPRTPR